MPGDSSAHVTLVGGGIASMAAAAFLIRDGDIPGHRITILEQLDRLGGSLDGLNRTPPPVYKGQYDPRVLYRAFRALHDIRS